MEISQRDSDPFRLVISVSTSSQTEISHKGDCPFFNGAELESRSKKSFFSCHSKDPNDQGQEIFFLHFPLGGRYFRDNLGAALGEIKPSLILFCPGATMMEIWRFDFFSLSLSFPDFGGYCCSGTPDRFLIRSGPISMHFALVSRHARVRNCRLREVVDVISR